MTDNHSSQFDPEHSQEDTREAQYYDDLLGRTVGDERVNEGTAEDAASFFQKYDLIIVSSGEVF